MTPRLARIALCGFAFLAGAVATNALYFQNSGQSPGRPVADRRPDKVTPEKAAWGERKSSRPSLQANSVKLDNPPEPGAADGKPDTIRAIQRELASRGYGPLTVDGVPGLATRAAIMAFEADEGLPLNGIANEQLLKVILLGATEADIAARAQTTARAQDVIRVAQNWLLTLGYQPGPATGTMTDETRNAIRAFETNAGLTPKGRISAEVIKRLADSVPLKAAAR